MLASKVRIVLHYYHLFTLYFFKKKKKKKKKENANLIFALCHKHDSNLTNIDDDMPLKFTRLCIFVRWKSSYTK